MTDDPNETLFDKVITVMNPSLDTSLLDCRLTASLDEGTCPPVDMTVVGTPVVEDLALGDLPPGDSLTK